MAPLRVVCYIAAECQAIAEELGCERPTHIIGPLEYAFDWRQEDIEVAITYRTLAGEVRTKLAVPFFKLTIQPLQNLTSDQFTTWIEERAMPKSYLQSFGEAIIARRGEEGLQLDLAADDFLDQYRAFLQAKV